ncbi:MAG: GTP-binding protein [Euryarchaeota archaeon]|nr:GTP-binding protein [Euryarchaeota archaeon]
MHSVKKKMVLLGDGAVGKTSLISRFVMNKFGEKYIATIGTRVSKKTVNVGDYEVTLLIWDVLGQKGYHRVQWASFKGAQGAFLVADLTRKSTLESLRNYWLPELEKIAPGIPIIYIGNKSDLPNWEITEEELQELASERDAEYIITSAKTGENVEWAFTKLAEKMVHIKNRDADTPVFTKDVKTLRDVVDYIIYDFSKHYGDMNDAMPIIRHQAELAGLNIHEPKIAQVRKFIENLYTVEKSYKGEEKAEQLRYQRMKLLKKVS